jgi:hypothetical protein
MRYTSILRFQDNKENTKELRRDNEKIDSESERGEIIFFWVDFQSYRRFCLRGKGQAFSRRCRSHK